MKVSTWVINRTWRGYSGPNVTFQITMYIQKQNSPSLHCGKECCLTKLVFSQSGGSFSLDGCIWHTSTDLSSCGIDSVGHTEAGSSIPIRGAMYSLQNPFKGYNKNPLSTDSRLGCICQAIDCDSPPSLKVHAVYPTVCTQRKIKLAFPSLWSTVLTDLSGVSLSSFS